MNKGRSILFVLIYSIACIIILNMSLKINDLKMENESLKGKIEMQQSVIADLEEDLRNK